MKIKPRELRELKSAAEGAALAAGKVLMRYFNKSFSVREKRGAGLVTNADLEAERTVLRILRRARTDFSFEAEESGKTKGTKVRLGAENGRWVIDPLDGTTNFVHGFPFFSVSIAAEFQGELVVGVVYHPCLDDLYVATRGKGAYKNGKRMRVSTTRTLRNSLLTTGFHYSHAKRKEEMKALESFIRGSRGIRRAGSAALDLAYVASGVYDGFWEQLLQPWDVAAGTLLVREAGGKVTDFRGEPFQINTKHIIASNSRLHRQLQSTVRKSLF